MKLTARGRNHDGHPSNDSSQAVSLTTSSSSPSSTSTSTTPHRRETASSPGGSSSSTSTSTPFLSVDCSDQACCRNDGRPFHHQKNPRKFHNTSSCSRWSMTATIRTVQHRWRLMTFRSKLTITVVTVLIVQYVLLGLWDGCFYRIGDDSGGQPGIGQAKGDVSTSLSAETTFAVVINTYKRPERLKRAVQHYAETCGRKYRVGQVFVVWAEQGVEVPEPSSFFESRNDSSLLRPSSTSYGSIRTHNRSEVHVLKKDRDSLNSRFEPIDELQTTSVFMVDDDILASCPSLLLAFQAWKAHPDSMVGYYPRLASSPLRSVTDRIVGQSASAPEPQIELVYHAWPIVHWRHRLNFVLTKASFLHARYLAMYTSKTGFPQAVRDHVDRHKNCEDIAMSMLVANYTRYRASLSSTSADAMPARPIYVEGQVSDFGLFGGISTGAGHMSTRSDCLTELTRIFMAWGWDPPFDYEYSLGESSWIRHSPGVWWQYRPSNVFEWFALANTFT